MITYALSNRQLKELANRKRLTIALPAPPADRRVGDWLAWSRAALPDVPAEWIRGARLDEVTVSTIGIGTAAIEDAIGAIARDPAYVDETLTWRVVVVLVTIATRDQTRGTFPPQWPLRWEI